MANADIPILKTDPYYSSLVYPVPVPQQKELENDLIQNGCHDPIIVSQGTIIDGHKRYAICQQYHIPFTVKEINLDQRELAIVWICMQQLQRQDIPTPWYRYLIGIQYEAEKRLRRRKNSLSKLGIFYDEDKLDATCKGRITAGRIAEQYGLGWSTVNIYGMYARALQDIQNKAPEVAQLIFSGQCKAAITDIVRISELPADQIRASVIPAKPSRRSQNQRGRPRKDNRGNIDGANPIVQRDNSTIKDTPRYNPDADITRLSLTIPTWVNMLDRSFASINFHSVSPQAKQDLKDTVKELLLSIRKITNALEEK